MDDRVGFLGVEGLDALLPAGLPYEAQIMLQGDTGIGKSVFAAQLIYEAMMVGDTCVYVACDDTPDTMRETLRAFRLGSLAYEEAGRLIFVDAYSRAGSKEKYRLPDSNLLDEFYLFQRELLEKLSDRPVRLIVDSLSTLLVQNEPSAFLSFNANRLKMLRRMNVFTLDAYVRGVLDERSVFSLQHAYPVIINMQFQQVDGGMRRVIQLGKLKSGEFQAQQLPFNVDPKTGIMVYR